MILITISYSNENDYRCQTNTQSLAKKNRLNLCFIRDLAIHFYLTFVAQVIRASRVMR